MVRVLSECHVEAVLSRSNPSTFLASHEERRKCFRPGLHVASPSATPRVLHSLPRENPHFTRPAWLTAWKGLPPILTYASRPAWLSVLLRGGLSVKMNPICALA